MNITQFRAKYPQYNDISDNDLANALHKKYYSDIPMPKFLAVFNPAPTPPKPLASVRKKFTEEDVYKQITAVGKSTPKKPTPSFTVQGNTFYRQFEDIETLKAGLPKDSKEYLETISQDKQLEEGRKLQKSIFEGKRLKALGMTNRQILEINEAGGLQTPAVDPVFVASGVFPSAIVTGSKVASAGIQAGISAITDIPIGSLYETLAPNHPILALITSMTLGIASGAKEKKIADALVELTGSKTEGAKLLRAVKTHVNKMPQSVRDSLQETLTRTAKSDEIKTMIAENGGAIPQDVLELLNKKVHTAIVKSDAPETGFDIVTKPKSILRKTREGHLQLNPEKISKEVTRIKVGKKVYPHGFKDKKKAMARAVIIGKETGKKVRLVPDPKTGKTFIHEVKTKRIVDFSKPSTENVVDSAPPYSKVKAEVKQKVKAEVKQNFKIEIPPKGTFRAPFEVSDDSGHAVTVTYIPKLKGWVVRDLLNKSHYSDPIPNKKSAILTAKSILKSKIEEQVKRDKTTLHEKAKIKRQEEFAARYQAKLFRAQTVLPKLLKEDKPITPYKIGDLAPDVNGDLNREVTGFHVVIQPGKGTKENPFKTVYLRNKKRSLKALNPFKTKKGAEKFAHKMRATIGDSVKVVPHTVPSVEAERAEKLFAPTAQDVLETLGKSKKDITRISKIAERAGAKSEAEKIDIVLKGELKAHADVSRTLLADGDLVAAGKAKQELTKNLDKLKNNTILYGRLKNAIKKLLGDETGSLFPKEKDYRPSSKKGQEVDDFFNKEIALSDKIKKDKQLRLRKITKLIADNFIDKGGELKHKLHKLGPLGQDVETEWALTNGAISKGEYLYNNHAKEIYGDLSVKAHKVLDKVLQAKRNITTFNNSIGKRLPGKVFKSEIAAEKFAKKYSKAHKVKVVPSREGEQIFIRRVEGIKQPGKFVATEFQEFLDDLRIDDPELYALMEKKAAIYHKVMRDSILEDVKAGIKTPEEGQKILDSGDYVKRVVLRDIAPSEVIGKNKKGKLFNKDGFAYIQEGTWKEIETDSALLMKNVLMHRTSARMENNARKALLTLARKNKNNGIVSINPVVGKIKRGVGKGKFKFATPPEGFQKLSVFENGKRLELLLPNEVYDQYIKMPPVFSNFAANILSWASGTKILKLMATGINPMFAMTNVIRDTATIYMSDYKNIYSTSLPKYMSQITKDITEVAAEAVKAGGLHKTKSFKTFVEAGGMMDFLSSQGQKSFNVNTHAQKIIDILGYANSSSELLTRMGYMNRAMKSGFTAKEAVASARSYLDFNVGGRWAKALSNIIPFFNASIQGVRAGARAARRNPKLFAFRTAQLGAVAMATTWLNNYRNREAVEQTNKHDKQNNVTFYFGEDSYFLDKNGVKKWMGVKLPLDQTEKVTWSVFEGFANALTGKEVEVGKIVRNAEGLVDITGFSGVMPPSMKAVYGYAANHSFWSGVPWWKGPDDIAAGAQANQFTSPILKQIGRSTQIQRKDGTFFFEGLSPVKLSGSLSELFPRGNVYSAAISAGFDKLAGATAEGLEDLTWQEKMARDPFTRRFIFVTDPIHEFGPQTKGIVKGTKTTSFKIKQNFDTLMFRYLRGKKTLKDVKQFLKDAPKEQRQSLMNRFKVAKLTFRLPDKRFWLDLQSATPEGRAQAFVAKFDKVSAKKQKEMTLILRKLPSLSSKRFWIKVKKMGALERIKKSIKTP